jgi:hypothetical protein
MLWIFIVIASIVSFYLGGVFFITSLKDEKGNRFATIIGELQKQVKRKDKLIIILKEELKAEKEKEISK